MSREEFVALVTTDLPEAPEYFSRDARLNREGPGSLAALPAPAALSPDEVERCVAAGALVLDTRPAAEYGDGPRPGLAADRPRRPVRVVGRQRSSRPRRRSCSSREDEDARSRKSGRAWRASGLENVVGYLAGGIRAWDAAGRPLARTEQIGVDELRGAARRGQRPRSRGRAPARRVAGRAHRAGGVAAAPRARRRAPRRSTASGPSWRSARAATARRSRRACSSGSGFEGSPTSSAAWRPGTRRSCEVSTQ